MFPFYLLNIRYVAVVCTMCVLQFVILFRYYLMVILRSFRKITPQLQQSVGETATIFTDCLHKRNNLWEREMSVSSVAADMI